MKLRCIHQVERKLSNNNNNNNNNNTTTITTTSSSKTSVIYLQFELLNALGACNYGPTDVVVVVVIVGLYSRHVSCIHTLPVAIMSF
jgi:hypothetical protein